MSISIQEESLENLESFLKIIKKEISSRSRTSHSKRGSSQEKRNEQIIEILKRDFETDNVQVVKNSKLNMEVYFKDKPISVKDSVIFSFQNKDICLDLSNLGKHDFEVCGLTIEHKKVKYENQKFLWGELLSMDKSDKQMEDFNLHCRLLGIRSDPSSLCYVGLNNLVKRFGPNIVDSIKSQLPDYIMIEHNKGVSYYTLKEFIENFDFDIFPHVHSINKGYGRIQIVVKKK